MIKLRRLKIYDLEKYEYWKSPEHKYHLLNGPYFRKKNTSEIKEQIELLRGDLMNGKSVLNNVRVIVNEKDKIIGEVSWYWKSEETYWLEIGIVIFDENFWNKGIGFSALKIWIDEVFKEKTEIIRIGITTWSGNSGMIKLATKLGMKEEARYRKARIVNGKYFDSVSYGMLKEEWKNN